LRLSIGYAAVKSASSGRPPPRGAPESEEIVGAAARRDQRVGERLVIEEVEQASGTSAISAHEDVVAAHGLEAAVDEGDHRLRAVEHALAALERGAGIRPDAIGVDALVKDRRAAAEGLRQEARLEGRRGDDPVGLGEGHGHGGVLGVDPEALLHRERPELRVEADIGPFRTIIEFGVDDLLGGREDLAQEHRLAPARLAQLQRGLGRGPAPDQIGLGSRRRRENPRRRAPLRAPAPERDARDLAPGGGSDRPAGVPFCGHRRRDETELGREVVVDEEEVGHADEDNPVRPPQRPRNARAI
jgi:hypothetical protein